MRVRRGVERANKPTETSEKRRAFLLTFRGKSKGRKEGSFTGYQIGSVHWAKRGGSCHVVKRDLGEDYIGSRLGAVN